MKNTARLFMVASALLVLTLVVACLFAFAPHSAHAKGATTNATTYTVSINVPNDLDSSTCGGNWATDSFRKVYTVTGNTVQLAFQNAKFVTLAGPSPDSCYIGTKTTLGAGIHGTFTGNETVVVTGGTFNPKAVCTAKTSCKTTAGFVALYYGPKATFTTLKYRLDYVTSQNGSWRNASNNRGGNFGDIYGYVDNG